eukprot:GILJ01009145.1.p1 GENE.GILJ01009145.1~~GILJ01009145.1.p1  ORF type:complete len:509 (+),score=83.00 GILJ01009145.1:32-1528(+)
MSTSDCVKEGFVSKLAGRVFSRWHTRYLVLKPYELALFKSDRHADQSIQPYRIIPVKLLKCIDRQIGSCFKLVTKNKSYTFNSISSSIEETEQWIRMIKAVSSGDMEAVVQSKTTVPNSTETANSGLSSKSAVDWAQPSGETAELYEEMQQEVQARIAAEHAKKKAEDDLQRQMELWRDLQSALEEEKQKRLMAEQEWQRAEIQIENLLVESSRRNLSRRGSSNRAVDSGMKLHRRGLSDNSLSASPASASRPVHSRANSIPAILSDEHTQHTQHMQYTHTGQQTQQTCRAGASSHLSPPVLSFKITELSRSLPAPVSTTSLDLLISAGRQLSKELVEADASSLSSSQESAVEPIRRANSASSLHPVAINKLRSAASTPRYRESASRVSAKQQTQKVLTIKAAVPKTNSKSELKHHPVHSSQLPSMPALNRRGEPTLARTRSSNRINPAVKAGIANPPLRKATYINTHSGSADRLPRKASSPLKPVGPWAGKMSNATR